MKTVKRLDIVSRFSPVKDRRVLGSHTVSLVDPTDRRLIQDNNTSSETAAGMLIFNTALLNVVGDTTCSSTRGHRDVHRAPYLSSTPMPSTSTPANHRVRLFTQDLRAVAPPWDSMSSTSLHHKAVDKRYVEQRRNSK